MTAVNVNETLDARRASELLARSGGGKRKIGVELEMSLLRQDDLEPATFDGPQGIERVLESLRARGEFRSEYEGEALIGLAAPDGEAYSLEPGGQFELSTAPLETLAEVGRSLREKTAQLAAIAEEHELFLLGGGIVLHGAEGVPWMPKNRYRIMREYFASLGHAGHLGHTMMQRTLSLQISLDFADAQDAMDLLRISLLAAPAATALFACSPFDGQEEAQCASLRAKAWLFTDPGRAQDATGCTSPLATLDDYTAYAFDAPMMFRVRDGKYAPMHGASFREVVERGVWPNGDPVVEKDWWTHLGSIFTNSRLKKGVIELRSTDGQRPEELLAVPAFWVGLLYDDTSRAAARELLGKVDLADHTADLERAPCQALADARLREQALALVELAQAGVERRVRAGIEPESVLDALRPAIARARAGRTPAAELLEGWRGEWAGDRRRLVDALRYPSA
ncbi:MAG: glutamate-cysteine ligase family protein [Planctomycetota bacterium]